MSNQRVFVQWSDPKAQTAYKENFRFPFLELLRLAGRSVAEGRMAGNECDGSCGKGDKQDHLHVSLAVRDVKSLYDAFQGERPVDVAFAERKLDGIAAHVQRLSETNPEADFAPAKALFEEAVKELAAMKTAGAKDYRPVAEKGDAVAGKAHEIVLTALAAKGRGLIAGLSEDSRKGCEEQIATALSAGDREGIRQLSHLVRGWETMAERLSRWGKKPQQDQAAEPAEEAGAPKNRDARRREFRYRPQESK